jgi:hypothetical protein
MACRSSIAGGPIQRPECLRIVCIHLEKLSKEPLDAEAVTSRPLALHGIARWTRYANQTTVEIASTHAKTSLITEALTKVSGFLKQIKANAEQLMQHGR